MGHLLTDRQSCITEDQKYQGHLYREKPSKAKRKSVSILEPSDHNALVPHKAYVEDAPDIDIPPHVPTPPSAVPSKPTDSVFDYMVEEPDTPRVAYGKEKGEMSMKNNAPALFTDSRASSRNGYRNKEEQLHSQEYEDNGFSYGTEPVNPRPYNEANPSLASLDFMTPSARTTKMILDKDGRPTLAHSRTNSGSEKKRKRGDEQMHDVSMTDAPDQGVRTAVNTPAVTHSGLTGGLSRMITDDSPDDNAERRRRDRERGDRRTGTQGDPTSPLKRSRQSKDDKGLGISIKGRAVRALSMVLPGAPAESAMVKSRRRTSSSEDPGPDYPRGQESGKRESKKHKVSRHNGTSSANIRHEPRTRRRGSEESPEAQRRKIKAIEYHKNEDSSDSDDGRKRNGTAQMVVFGAEEKSKRRCETFIANIPGAEYDKGYSIHKVLKRWHKQCDVRSSSHKNKVEEELWRALRLRKNDRGEIVVSF